MTLETPQSWAVDQRDADSYGTLRPPRTLRHRSNVAATLRRPNAAQASDLRYTSAHSATDASKK